MLDETRIRPPRRRVGKWNERARNSFSFLFRLAANKGLLMFGCHHDSVCARTTILTAWAECPPHRQPGLPPVTAQCSSSTTSFPSKNSNKGVLKYQKVSRDCGKQLLKMLLLPERASPSLRGKVIPSPTPCPLEKTILAHLQTLQRLP